MTEEKTVGGGRLWGEALGLAVIFFAAQILFAVLGGVFYAAVLAEPGTGIDALADPALNARIAIYTLPLGTIVTLFAAHLMLKSRGVDWRNLGLKFPNNLLKTILYGTGIFVVTAILAAAANIGMESLGYTQDLSLFDVLKGDLVMYLFLATIISWFAAGFAEEFIFRGFIMGNLAQAMGNSQGAWIAATLMQALIFGLFHAYQGLNGIVVVSMVALVFGFFYYRLKSLWPVIIAHGIMDTFGMTMLYLDVDIPV